MYLSVNHFLQSGKYRIIRFIGSGGFGCTYEAEHVLLKKRVAIKEFFVKDFCNRDEVTACVTVGTQSKKELVNKLKNKFIEEARSISTFSHPGIVSVSDVFEENGTAYYVMNYIEGRSLLELVEHDGPLSEKRALYYIRQLCDALAYVHEHHRLHLDIKPGNIMIDESDHVILIDFGASKQYDACEGMNHSTLLGKTPGYAPLEQMDDDVKNFLPATDIYAVGATLYKLLTGRTPLSATKLANGEVLSEIPEEVTMSTRHAVLSAMTLNKMQRPQCVADFLHLLEKNPTKPVIGNKVTLVKIGRSRGRWFMSSLGLLIIVLSFFLFKNKSKIKDMSVVVRNEINGHGYVDLGLPSGLKWATCNVGALSPEDYGDYYAWGEIQIKSEYIEDNALTLDKNLGEISGNPRYDVARVLWGENWRLPTKGEFEELRNNCQWQWKSQVGQSGYLVVGPNGNSIFLPAAGWYSGSAEKFTDELGGYGSSTPDETNPQDAYGFYFTSEDQYIGGGDRSVGRSIRPVSD